MKQIHIQNKTIKELTLPLAVIPSTKIYEKKYYNKINTIPIEIQSKLT